MHKSGVFLASLVLSASVGQALVSQDRPAPAPIAAGFTAYKADGANAAVKAWLKGSPLEGNKDAMSQANILHQVEDYYGSFIDYRVVKDVTFTPTCRLTYVQLDFEKGPAFARFLTFKGSTGWHLVSFVFNTNPDQVWPNSLYLSPEEHGE